MSDNKLNFKVTFSMASQQKPKSTPWVVIFGGSSGIGLATARKLSTLNYNLIIVHFDRKKQLIDIAPDLYINKEIICINTDVNRKEGKEKIQETIKNKLPKDSISLFLYSITGANVGSITEDASDLGLEKMMFTHHSMSHGLYFWTIWFLEQKYFIEKARVIGLSYSGSSRYVKGYGYPGIAKASMEATLRYLACETGKYNLRCNIITAGVMDTPALKAIPDNKKMLQKANETNPSGRLTNPEDVADVIYLLMQPEADWINGANLHVDGGEHLM